MCFHSTSWPPIWKSVKYKCNILMMIINILMLMVVGTAGQIIKRYLFVSVFFDTIWLTRGLPILSPLHNLGMLLMLSVYLDSMFVQVVSDGFDQMWYIKNHRDIFPFHLYAVCFTTLLFDIKRCPKKFYGLNICGSLVTNHTLHLELK